MSKYYLLLAFDALLFGAVAMSLDLLMGYTGPRLVRPRRLLRPGRLRHRGPARARASPRSGLCLGASPSSSSASTRSVVSYFATARRGHLLRAAHADLRRGGLHRSSATRRPSAGSDGIQGAARRRAAARRRHRHAARGTTTWSWPTWLFAYLVCRVLVALALRPGARRDPRERGPRALPRLRRAALQDGRCA